MREHAAPSSQSGCTNGKWSTRNTTLQPPHILYIGGEDHHLRLPAMLELRELGFRVTAAGSGDPRPFIRAGVNFHPFHVKRFLAPKSDLATCRELRELLAHVRPDIAHSFDTKLSLLLPLAAQKPCDVRIVRTINGRGWTYSSRSPLALALRPIYRTLHRMGAPSVAATVFEIREDQAFFERHRMIGNSRSVVIPGAGVDVEGFTQALTDASQSAELRQSLGLGDSEVVITVTRMTRQKGILTLLKAAAIVHRVRPSVRFLLVGPRQSEGPAAVSQAALDRHAPYVKAIGPRSDVPALLQLATVFAFPTEYHEGVPRVILEAALAGLPIVTTRVPGCSEVIRDGWNGVLVPLRSPHVLAARILDLLADRQTAQTMAARAASRVRQHFGVGLVIAQQAALYRAVIQRSATGKEVDRTSFDLPVVSIDREPLHSFATPTGSARVASSLHPEDSAAMHRSAAVGTSGPQG